MENNEIELFRKEMSDVVPLKQAEPNKPNCLSTLTPGQIYRRKAAENFTHSNNFLPTSFIHPLTQYDILCFKRNGIQNGVFRKLKRGDYPVEAVLDLHKASVEKARNEVYRFILDCYKYDVRTAIIRHGKGIHAKQSVATLKSCIARWLPMLPEILAFHSAQNQHGGTGAVYVLIRKGEKQRQVNRRRFGLCG